MKSASESQAGATVTTLLATTSSVALAITCLALLSPSIAVSATVAKLVGELLAMAALLITAWAAPARGANRGYWFLSLVALEGLLFCMDLGTFTPELLCLKTVVVLTTAALVGGYIGSLLEYPGMLMVVSYVAALADCCSVAHPNGLTAQVLLHPEALALLTLSVPLLGSHEIMSLVGIGDVAFVSLYVAGARATGLDPKRTLLALGIAMGVVALTVEHLSVPLPALPFLGGAVLLAHPEARRLPPAQRRRIAANLAVVTLVLGGVLWSGLRRGPEQATHGTTPPALSAVGRSAASGASE